MSHNVVTGRVGVGAARNLSVRLRTVDPMEGREAIDPMQATGRTVLVEYAALRHAVLLALLDLGGTATVSEMARRLEAQGITSRRYLTRAVSDAGTWKTPRPSCGIACPSFRRIAGTVIGRA